jgi:hypothetical protein
MKMMQKDSTRILSIKPTSPGFLLVQYKDGTAETIETFDAPKESEVLHDSPVFEGHSDEACPHCQDEMVNQYRFVFFSRIVGGKVYSFNSRDWDEQVVAQSCTSCAIPIFAWEKRELYLEYAQIDKRRKGLSGTVRIEPVTQTPGNCPGEKMVAWKDAEARLECQGYPRCVRTGECKEDWRISIGNSKISTTNLFKAGNADRFFEKYDV